jgi:outer membrane lipoprotein SlyB
MHPLAIAAAASIIALSAVGISVLLYNRSEAQNAPAGAMASNTATAPGDTVPPPPAGFDNTAPVPANATNAAAPVTPAAAPVAMTADPNAVAGAQVPADALGAPPPPMAQAIPPSCVDCATVVAERPITVSGRGTGLGAVGGGIAGGLIGNTIGHGRGNVAMTLLGAAGGALAGNAIEEHARTRTEYQMVVRYPNGHERTFTHGAPWGYQVGETVRVVHGRVVALN